MSDEYLSFFDEKTINHNLECDRIEHPDYVKECNGLKIIKDFILQIKL